MIPSKIVVRDPKDSATSWLARFERTTGNGPKIKDIMAAGWACWHSVDLTQRIKMKEYSEWMLDHLAYEDYVIMIQRDRKYTTNPYTRTYEISPFNSDVTETMVIFFTNDTDMVMFKLAML